MKGFSLELVIKLVMIQLDRLRPAFSAVNDPGHLAGTAQAAARTLALHVRLLAVISICI